MDSSLDNMLGLSVLIGAGCLCFAITLMIVIGIALALRPRRPVAPAVDGIAPPPRRGEVNNASLTKLEEEQPTALVSRQIGPPPTPPPVAIGPTSGRATPVNIPSGRPALRVVEAGPTVIPPPDGAEQGGNSPDPTARPGTPSTGPGHPANPPRKG